MRRYRASLQSKIAIAMWSMAAISTFVSAIVTGGLLIGSHKESVRQQLQATATSLVTLGITHFSELKDFEELNLFVEDALQMDRVDKIIRIYDQSHKLIFTTAGADYDRLPDTLAHPLEKPAFLTIEGIKKKYESIILPYEGAGNRKKFYLQVATPLAPYSEILENLWWQSLLLMGVLIGISVAFSQVLSKRLLKPVGIIADHLQRMDPVKIGKWRPLDIGKQGRYLNAIIDGVNLLSERTRTAIARLGKISRYVAHEMRTPLTILQGEAEMVLLKKDATASDYEGVLRSSLEEIQRMSEIVNTVLQVGERAQVAPFFSTISFNLGDWLLENKLNLENTLGRSIDLKLPAKNVEVKKDPKLLYRLIDNLVRNVRTHTPAKCGCFIELSLSDEGRAVIAIRDDGPGLGQDMIDSLNENGSSSDAAGVGLNLCYRIAEMSGLELVISKVSVGGLGVEIRF